MVSVFLLLLVVLLSSLTWYSISSHWCFSILFLNHSLSLLIASTYFLGSDSLPPWSPFQSSSSSIQQPTWFPWFLFFSPSSVKLFWLPCRFESDFFRDCSYVPVKFVRRSSLPSFAYSFRCEYFFFLQVFCPVLSSRSQTEPRSSPLPCSFFPQGSAHSSISCNCAIRYDV